MGFLDFNSAEHGTKISKHPVPFAEFHVFFESSNIRVPLYGDEDLTDTTANPVLADASGKAPLCYVRNGAYRVEVHTRNGGKVLETFSILAESSLQTNYLRSFRTVQELLLDTSLAKPGHPLLRSGAFLHVTEGDFSYEIADPDSTDYDLKTMEGIKLRVMPDGFGLNVLAFGADPTGESACEAAFFSCIQAARSRALSIMVPSGYYRVEKGIDFIGSDSISGYAINLNVHGAGHESTVFFSHGAPDYIIRINARYFEISGFSVRGSRDGIRDREHSAPIGIWIQNMREGKVVSFKVQNIVGSGLQIDRCIVSRIDGIVYRCGSNTRRAVEQTNAAQDGCQASWVRLSCEDGHGLLGAVKFLSHRNTHIDVKLENQPYHIVEVLSPMGRPVRGEVISFSSGATGTVALTSPHPIYNTRGQLVLKDIVGKIAPYDTFISSGGGRGTAIHVTYPGGPQFEAAGEYGVLSIFANQNALKTEPSGDIILSGSNTHVERANIRGKRRAKAMLITGSAYTIDSINIDQSMKDVGVEAEFDWGLEISGSENVIKSARLRNCKGLVISGSYCRIFDLDQRELYGVAVRITGDHSGVKYAFCSQATYAPPSRLDGSLVQLVGKGSFFGTDGGILNLPYNATDGVLLAGDQTRLGPVNILDTGNSICGIRMTGAESTVDQVRLTVSANSVGIRNVAKNGRIDRPYITGGSVSIELKEEGASLFGGTLTQYSVGGVSAMPSTVKGCMRIEGVTFENPTFSAAYDIQVNDNVSYSHFINNNLRFGKAAASYGIGVSNFASGNIT